MIHPSCGDEPNAGEQWTQLFNGENLDGWTPKIRFQDVGDDPARTFRVEDGLLKVRYDGYDNFNEAFGHLFYDQPFSHYRLRTEYRFVGKQCEGGPGWAIRNSGLMIHGQPADTMARDQKFPVSIEVQLLGGDGQNKRPTLNLCTPGTNVVYQGKLFRPHCTKSSSKTYHGNGWVTAEIEARGHQVIKHIIDGQVVLQYEEPQLDPSDTDAQRILQQDDEIKLTGGSISLQSESHPVDFRKVEILVLKPVN